MTGDELSVLIVLGRRQRCRLPLLRKLSGVELLTASLRALRDAGLAEYSAGSWSLTEAGKEEYNRRERCIIARK
jgi:hypothetical protein